MNKFEEHWRKKMDDPEEYRNLLSEKVRAAMWDKIAAAKKDFEQTWQKKVNDIEAWEGTLEEETKKALWDKVQIPLAPFELQWQEKIEAVSQADSVFLDESAKERIATSVFSEKETFESDWQGKMDDPVLAGQDILNAAAKDRIWRNIQSGTTKGADARKEKNRPLFVLRWSHAAALLIGAFSTWLIWERSSTPLQNTLAIAPPEAMTPAVNPVITQKEIVLAAQHEKVDTKQEALSKPATKVIAKGKSILPVKESRNVVERVTGKVTPVKAVQSAAVLANAVPVLNNSKTTAPEEKTNTTIGAPENELAINNKPFPAKKVVHISDIRPAAAPVKGAAIYGRAFGDGKEKRNEKSTMTFNSVLKNYK